MKITLDPYMFRRVPLTDLPGLVADLGYQYLELSPREDFMPFFLMPRADDTKVKAFKKALDGAGVKVASNLPLYRWSGPDEDERQAAENLFGVTWDFKAPMRPGDTIRALIAVTGKRAVKNPALGLIELAIELASQQDEILQSGLARLLLRRTRPPAAIWGQVESGKTGDP